MSPEENEGSEEINDKSPDWDLPVLKWITDHIESRSMQDLIRLNNPSIHSSGRVNPSNRRDWPNNEFTITADAWSSLTELIDSSDEISLQNQKDINLWPVSRCFFIIRSQLRPPLISAKDKSILSATIKDSVHIHDAEWYRQPKVFDSIIAATRAIEVQREGSLCVLADRLDLPNPKHRKLLLDLKQETDNVHHRCSTFIESLRQLAMFSCLLSYDKEFIKSRYEYFYDNKNTASIERDEQSMITLSILQSESLSWQDAVKLSFPPDSDARILFGRHVKEIVKMETYAALKTYCIDLYRQWPSSVCPISVAATRRLGHEYLISAWNSIRGNVDKISKMFPENLKDNIVLDTSVPFKISDALISAQEYDI